MARIIAHTVYCLGEIVFQLKPQHDDLSEEIESVLSELKRKEDLMRMQELTMLLRTGKLLLEALKLSNLSSECPNGDIHERFNKDVDGFITSINNYLTTVGVVAALLLGISIQWIMTPLTQSVVVSFTNTTQSNDPQDSVAHINIAMVLLMVLSASFSMLALVISFGIYCQLNIGMSVFMDRLWFLRQNLVSACKVYIIIAVASLSASVLLAIYIIYGRIVLITACVIVSICFAYYFFIVVKFMATSHNHLIGKTKKQIQKLHEDYKQYKTNQTISGSTITSITSMPVSIVGNEIKS